MQKNARAPKAPKRTERRNKGLATPLTSCCLIRLRCTFQGDRSQCWYRTTPAPLEINSAISETVAYFAASLEPGATDPTSIPLSGSRKRRLHSVTAFLARSNQAVRSRSRCVADIDSSGIASEKYTVSDGNIGDRSIRLRLSSPISPSACSIWRIPASSPGSNPLQPSRDKCGRRRPSPLLSACSVRYQITPRRMGDDVAAQSARSNAYLP